MTLSNNHPPKVLIIRKNPDVRGAWISAVKAPLEAHGYETVGAETRDAALQLGEQLADVALIITKEEFTRPNPGAFMTALKDSGHGDIQVLFAVSSDPAAQAYTAIPKGNGNAHEIRMPFGVTQLREKVVSILENQNKPAAAAVPEPHA